MGRFAETAKWPNLVGSNVCSWGALPRGRSLQRDAYWKSIPGNGLRKNPKAINRGEPNKPRRRRIWNPVQRLQLRERGGDPQNWTNADWVDGPLEERVPGSSRARRRARRQICGSSSLGPPERGFGAE